MNNRIIKFRAWDNAFGTMESDVQNSQMFYHMIDSPERFTLMQFTGLHDKHGKEIYEGDIMRILQRDWPSQSDYSIPVKDYMISISCLCVVTFEDGAFIPKHHSGEGSWFNEDFFPRQRDIFEVIGSIHSTPELLNL